MRTFSLTQSAQAGLSPPSPPPAKTRAAPASRAKPKQGTKRSAKPAPSDEPAASPPRKRPSPVGEGSRKRPPTGDVSGEEEHTSSGQGEEWRAKFEVLVREKEALQAQFDELYALRHTRAEQLLQDLTVAADERDRLARETIASLRRQVGSGPAGAVPAREAAGEHVRDPDTGDQLSAAEAVRLLVQERREKEAALSAQEALQEEARETRRLLDAEVASSKALLSRSGAKSARPPPSADGVASEEDRAVRRLYEDLTGIVLRSVDRLGEDGQTYPLSPGDAERSLRFKGLFASKGFFSIEFVLQSFPSDKSSPLGRLRFVPSLRPEREEDAQLIDWLRENGAPFLTKPLSFGRDTAPRFLAHFLNAYDAQE